MSILSTQEKDCLQLGCHDERILFRLPIVAAPDRDLVKAQRLIQRARSTVRHAHFERRVPCTTRTSPTEEFLTESSRDAAATPRWVNCKTLNFGLITSQTNYTEADAFVDRLGDENDPLQSGLRALKKLE